MNVAISVEPHGILGSLRAHCCGSILGSGVGASVGQCIGTCVVLHLNLLAGHVVYHRAMLARLVLRQRNVGTLTQLLSLTLTLGTTTFIVIVCRLILLNVHAVFLKGMAEVGIIPIYLMTHIAGQGCCFGTLVVSGCKGTHVKLLMQCHHALFVYAKLTQHVLGNFACAMRHPLATGTLTPLASFLVGQCPIDFVGTGDNHRCSPIGNLISAVDVV